MLQYAGNCRFLWNKALALNLYRLENKQPLLWSLELDWFSKLWKQSDEYGFLKLSPTQALQQTLKQLERAFKDGFDPSQPLKKIPTFKKPENLQIKNMTKSAQGDVEVPGKGSSRNQG